MAALRVMVVDDSPIFVRTLQLLLRRDPRLTVVATAKDGIEALPLLHETQPQVLILDIKMPQMNGWQLLDELHRVKSSLHVIMLSAFPDENAEQRALSQGATAYVNKADSRRFFDTLQTIIDSHSNIKFEIPYPRVETKRL